MDRVRELDISLTFGVKRQLLFNFMVNRIVEGDYSSNMLTTLNSVQCGFSNRVRLSDQRVFESHIRVAFLWLINRITSTKAIDWISTKHVFNALYSKIQALLLV